VALGVPDYYFHNANGTIIVREGSGPLPWMVTWLPDDHADPAYPGVTLSSTEGQVPIGPSIEAIVEWAGRQPWANRTRQDESAPGHQLADVLDVPTDEWSDLQDRAFEHGVRLGFTKEPDGSFSWGLFSSDDKLLQHGVADNWDDARLAMIENLHPPSGEA
jgi:hypothetical protein